MSQFSTFAILLSTGLLLNTTACTSETTTTIPEERVDDIASTEDAQQDRRVQPKPAAEERRDGPMVDRSKGLPFEVDRVDDVVTPDPAAPKP